MTMDGRDADGGTNESVAADQTRYQSPVDSINLILGTSVRRCRCGMPESPFFKTLGDSGLGLGLMTAWFSDVCPYLYKSWRCSEDIEKS